MVIARTVVVSLKQPANSTAVLPGVAEVVHRERLFGDELREVDLGESCD